MVTHICVLRYVCTCMCAHVCMHVCVLGGSLCTQIGSWQPREAETAGCSVWVLKNFFWVLNWKQAQKLESGHFPPVTNGSSEWCLELAFCSPAGMIFNTPASKVIYYKEDSGFLVRWMKTMGLFCLRVWPLSIDMFSLSVEKHERFFPELRTGPRALGYLGKHSTSELNLPPWEVRLMATELLF